MAQLRRLFARRGIQAVALVGVGLVIGLLVAGPPAGAVVPIEGKYTPIGMTTSSPSKVTVAPAISPPTAVEITPKEVITDSENVFVQLGLPWDNGPVTGVEVCYRVITPSTVPQGIISQTRLTDMTTPGSVLVRMDDGGDHPLKGPICYTTPANFTPAGAVTLHLKVKFGITTERLQIGLVRLIGLTTF